MTGSLSAAQVEQFGQRGFLCPVPVLLAAEVAALNERLAEYERAHGPLSGSIAALPHLVLTWVDALIRHPAILDAMESILGPNLLVWGCNFFIKGARTPNFVSWHQDSTYWGLDPADVATAWVAFTDSDTGNGCVPAKCRSTTSSWCTVPGPTARTGAESASRFASCHPTCARSPASSIGPHWCAESIPTDTSPRNANRLPIWSGRRSAFTPRPLRK